MRQDSNLPVDPPSLNDLFTRYLENRVASGLAPEESGEIVLHDAGPVQPIEPRLAWDDALAALNVNGPKAPLPAMSAVADWRGLVAAQEPALDLAFCAGNFPQMVRNLTLLLRDQASGADTPRTRPFESTSLRNWAEQSLRKPMPQALLAAGLLRLAQDYDGARRILQAMTVPAEWQTTLRNEEAALLWHSGKREEVAAIWATLDDNLPALFNRGMAALFLGKPAEAITPLKQVIARLPESASWHHLARLYLTLAEMRR